MAETEENALMQVKVYSGVSRTSRSATRFDPQGCGAFQPDMRNSAARPVLANHAGHS